MEKAVEYDLYSLSRTLFFYSQALYYIMLVAVYGFFSRVSDPRFGGTYMTLFNTANTLGWSAPRTLALKLVDKFTFYECSDDVLDNCLVLDSKNVSNRSMLLVVKMFETISTTKLLDDDYVIVMYSYLFQTVSLAFFKNPKNDG